MTWQIANWRPPTMIVLYAVVLLLSATLAAAIAGVPGAASVVPLLPVLIAALLIGFALNRARAEEKRSR